jgi:hypothetical protein
MSVQGQQIYGADCRVVTTAKLDVDAAGVISPAVPVLLGQPEYCHMVTFGSGIEIAVNPYSSEDWNRGSILCRTLADVDFLLTDESRWSIGLVTL